jgi:hypothetical protein
MVKIKAKLDDDKYQKIMSATGGAWNYGRVSGLMLGLLDTYNTCLFNIGMSVPVTAERADFMANGMVSWKQTFINKSFLPKQKDWDAVQRTPEDPMAAITAAVVDDSSDDEADYADKPAVLRGRSMKFGQDPANTKQKLEEVERKSAARTAAFGKYPENDPRHPFHPDYVAQEIAHANYTADACEHAPRDW